MTDDVKSVISNYLQVYPNEKDRLSMLKNFVSTSSKEELVDWNNIKGHLTVGAIVYSQSEDSFLVLYHKDLDMYMYPGGHVDKEDKTLLLASLRELKEETGIYKLKSYLDIPFDIDIHLIPYNGRIKMAEHYHFDFRFIFVVDNTFEIAIDENEFSNYKWISTSELLDDEVFGKIIIKVRQLLNM